MWNIEIQGTGSTHLHCGERPLIHLLRDNNRDVGPMCEAIAKHHAYFSDFKVDIHKDCISLPGAANLTAFKDLPELGSQNPQIALWKDEDAKTSTTNIRDTVNLVARCLGVDANSLYPWALAQLMPTGDYVVIKIPTIEFTASGILEGTIFGFVKCSIDCPDRLKQYFSEFSPIFYNYMVDDGNGKESWKLI